MPWATASLCLLLALITGVESTICLIMTIPIYLPLASLGGILAGIAFTAIDSSRVNSFALGALLTVPLVVSGIEERYPLPEDIRQVDPHVVVGGRYFDTLVGQYQIEKIAEGQVCLHLLSRYKLSTRFNFYAEMWADFLMRDIQENILRVIKSRAERH